VAKEPSFASRSPESFIVQRPSTGSWYRYRTIPIGRLYLAKSDPFTVRASCQTLKEQRQ
jgi:hypothetical protein